MSNIFDWSQSLFGVQDPREEMARYADEQRRQNRAAIGYDPNNPNAAPTPAPGANAAPDPNAAPDANSAAAVAAGSTLPPNQTPNAVKSDPSMGRMIVELERYDERKKQFNSSLGGLFATISQPRNRPMMEHAFDADLPDPAKFGESIMAVSSQQQGQDRANAVLRMINDPIIGPKIAQAYGMDWAGLKAGALADPGLVARIAETWGTADPKVRAGTQVGHGALGGATGGAAGGPISDVGKQIVSEVGGQPAMEQAQMDWDKKHPGQPTPWNRNDVASFNIWDANQKDLNESVNKAREIHSTVLPTLVDMKNRIATIKNNPNLDRLLTDPIKRQQAQQLLSADPNTPWSVVIKLLPEAAKGLSQEELNLVADIRQLNGQEYGAALQTLHQTRPAASEVAAMKTGIGQTQSLELSPDAYRDQALDSLDDYIKTEIATSYGQSQNFKDMPEEYRPYVNPQFVKGGTRNLEGSGSEDWADKVKPSEEEIATARKAITSGQKTRAQVDRWMRAHGMRAEGY